MAEEHRLDRLTSILKRRGVILPSFEIYGGVSGLIDYGPIGARIKRKVIDSWINHWMRQGDVIEIDSPTITPEQVLIASGHVGEFNDLMTECMKCNSAFRADHIGYIFQNFNLLPYLTPLENVCLGCQFSKKRQQHVLSQVDNLESEAARLLNALGLEAHFHNQNVATLSIGQQQRVAAARAFIGSPELIIADEPTSALDTQNRESFIKLLFEQAKKSNSTLVFVSHDETLKPLFSRTIDLVSLQGDV